jgi:hypothetical protein
MFVFEEADHGCWVCVEIDNRVMVFVMTVGDLVVTEVVLDVSIGGVSFNDDC